MHMSLGKAGTLFPYLDKETLYFGKQDSKHGLDKIVLVYKWHFNYINASSSRPMDPSVTLLAPVLGNVSPLR